MIPERLKIEGLRFIKVRSKDKIPVEAGWQKEKNYSFNDEALENHFGIGGNYGVATGFGDLVVIDSDHPETQVQVEKHLPDTFKVSTGKGTHNYYICKSLKDKIVLSEDSSGKHYGEVQTQGQQVVAPGSTHPNGHKYAVINDVDIIEVNEQQIKSALKDLMKQKSNEKVRIKSKPVKAISCNKGSRNETLFKMACSFKSRGITKEEALNTLLTINDSNNPPLQKTEVNTVVESAYKYSMKWTELRIDDYMDNTKLFWKKQPFFFDKQQLFWMWNFKLNKWEITDETDIMRIIDNSLELKGETVKSNNKTCYIESIKRVGREFHPEEAPNRWIQFKDKAFSLRSGNVYDVQPNYFFCNPIPWSIGDSCETPVMDKLFEEWVGKKYVKTLYEIIAYCCYSDYPIQTLFCFLGHGRNGKSQFQKVLAKFIGEDNVCSTELDQLTNNRFESFKLYKKLLCSMGETNFGVLTSTSIIKKLTGGDLIGFEKKNKDPFDGINYAKIIINSNSLPSSEDTSEGFYRRWMIVSFPNQFKEGTDIVATIPKQEYNNLAKKVCNIIPLLLERGSFTHQGDIDERKNRYIEASNPLSLFLNTFCLRSGEGYIRYSTLFKAYVQFLSNKKTRIVSRKEFNAVLSLQGLEIRRTSKYINEHTSERDTWVEGVEFNEDESIILQKLIDNSNNSQNSTEF